MTVILKPSLYFSRHKSGVSGL